MKNVGFVVIGKMASAIIKGLSLSNMKDEIKVYGYDHHPFKNLKTLSEQELITPINNLNELIEKSDYIFLCLKPNIILDVISDIDKNIIKDKIFISVAANVSIIEILNSLNLDSKVIRIMPNVNASINQSVTAISSSKNINEDEFAFAQKLINSFGSSFIIDEKLFEIFAAIAGSMPAIVFMFIDIISNVALKHGIQKNIASEIVSQVVLTSGMNAKLASENGYNIRSLMDQVMSPGGTTVKAITKLEDNGFAKQLQYAIEVMLNNKTEK